MYDVWNISKLGILICIILIYINMYDVWNSDINMYKT